MSTQAGNTTVDQRIVEMRIDNEKFEAGAKKTINILESLDRSLKGIGQENADGFDQIGESLDKVTDRFSAMGIVGDQVMRNLTNKAMELVSSLKNVTTMLTTQQIGAGWNKYADKTQAIQTIMAATNKEIENGHFADQAEQLEWVNEQIEKLNKFTDETSYNFLDMVGNIGKFTAAGRGLEESVTAMEGIATWAAISGGRPAEASRAMYNLSQALGMGKVTQLDWKSIENANMATYEFKQQVIDVAEQLGTVKKISDGIWEDMDGHEVTVESFRENLKDGWFDSDVLLTVLNRYGEFSDVLLDVSEQTGETATVILKEIKAFKETGKVADWLAPYIETLTKDEYELGLRAFQAAQEAKTFQEAIDATKDAVSTKWMTVFELLFGNYLEAKELWTQMSEVFWDIFAQPVDHLIDIIKGARGIVGEDGIFGTSGIMGDPEQAAGGISVLESRLTDAGKTMKDFYSVLEKTLGPDGTRALTDSYGTLEEALLRGAISAETFKKALAQLTDQEELTGGTMTLTKALAQSGKTMEDFEKAVKEVADPKEYAPILGMYHSAEEALKRGALSADLFKKALNSLGIDSENVAQVVDTQITAATGSLAGMRDTALGILRGDFGNGEERRHLIEAMGLDYELMQAMAGDLMWGGYNMTDEKLMEWMEQYYSFNNLKDRLGYETFADYLNAITSASSDAKDTLEDDADAIYASLFGADIVNELGEYRTAGELFRESISNLLEALDKFGEAFDKAFLKVFGGAKDYDEQVGRLSDGFFTLTAAFWSFSNRVKAFSESETFLNFATALMSVLRVIGKVIGFVFKIGSFGLKLIMKLLSPVLKMATSLFEIISLGIDTMSRSIEDSGIFAYLEDLGNDFLTRVGEPIKKVCIYINALVDAFREGMEEGGIAGGIEKMTEKLDKLLIRHPTLLKVLHAIGDAFVFLGDVISTVAMVLGGIFGGAIAFIVAGFSKLGEWFSKFITWATESELLAGIWTTLTDAFTKFGNVVKCVFGYAEQGYKEGGFVGAFTAILESFERGVKRLVPGGKQIIEIFQTIANTIRSIFGKKTVDEADGLTEAEDLVTRLGDKVQAASDGLLRLEASAEGLIPKVERAAEAVDTVVQGAFGTEEEKESFKDKVAQFIQNLWDGILKGLSQIKLSDVIGAMRLSLIASIVTSITGAVTVFKDIGRSIRSIPETINEIGERFGNMMRSLSATFTANAVLKFAAAAVLIGVALRIIAKIPKDTLTHSASVVVVMLAAVALMANAFAKLRLNTFKMLGQLPNMTGLLFGLVGFIGALTAAVVAFTVLQFLGPGKFTRAAATIGLLLLVLGGIIVAIEAVAKSTNMERIRAIGKMMIGIGAAMMMVGIAIMNLALPIALLTAVQFLGVGKFRRAVLAVIAILVVLGLLIRSMLKASKDLKEQEISAIGKMLLRIAGSMAIVAFAMQMLVIPISAFAAVQKFIGVEAFKMAVLAVGLLIGLLSTLVGIFSWFLVKAGYSNMEQIGKTMLRVAASMAITAVAIRLMTGPIIRIAGLCAAVNNWDVFTAVVTLLGTVAAIGALLTHFNKKGGMNGGGGMLKVAGAITLIALAMLFLTPAIIGLTIAVSMFATALGAMNDKAWSAFAKGLWRLVAVSGAVLVFGTALFVLGAGIVAAGAGLVVVAGGVFLLVAALAVLMIALPKFIEMLKDLKDTSMNDLWNSIRKVGLAFLLFSVVLGAVIISLNKLFGLIGPGGLRKIGSGFMTFIQGLVSSATSGVSNGFSKVVTFLQDPKNRATILAALQTVILVAAAYAAGLIPTLAHVVVGGIVTLISSIADEIAGQSGTIVDSLAKLVGAIVGVVKDLIARLFGEESWSEMSWWQKGVSVLTGGLLAANRVAGIFSFGKAEKSAGSLSDKILGIADNIGNAKEKVTDMKSAFNDTKAAVQLLVEAAGGLGVVLPVALALAAAVAYATHNLNQQQDILRQNAGDPKTLEEYEQSILDVENRIKELTELEQSGWGTEMSSQELAAQQILLRTLKKEYEELQESTEGAADAEAASSVTQEEAIARLREMKDTIDATTSAREKSELRGDYKRTMNDYAEALGITVSELEALVTAEQNVAQTAAATTETTTENVSKLSDIFSQYGIDKMFGDADIAGAFKEAVANQGIDINDFISSDGSGLDTEKLSKLINLDQLKTDLSGKLSDVGQFLPEGIADGLPLGEPYMTDALNGIKDTMLSTLFTSLGIASPSTVMRDEVGIYIPAGIGEGISSNQSAAISPVGMLINNMLKLFSTVKQNFAASGASVVTGLAQGVVNNMEIAYQAGQSLAESLENGFRERLQIESPSRVFESLAGYIPAGITQGIQDGQGGAIDSVVVLGDELVNAIMQSMAMVSAVADDEFDLQPHITPVVDLSNVNSAAGAVGSAFSGGYQVSAQMSGAINRRMADVERLASAMNSSRTVNNTDQITFNIYQQPGQNTDELAEVVMQRMSTRLTRRGAAFG